MKTVPEMYLGCDGASQNPHPSDADSHLSDADFMCKIRWMQM